METKTPVNPDQSAAQESPWSGQDRALRLLWEFCWFVFCAWTPKPANPWRLFWLDVFGATIEGKPFVHQRARIAIPWHLTLRDRACLRSEEHTSELQSRFDLVCRLLLQKKNTIYFTHYSDKKQKYIYHLIIHKLLSFLFCFRFIILIFFYIFFFFFNDTATTEIYTLSLHDALPILACLNLAVPESATHDPFAEDEAGDREWIDRKSTRLNSSHVSISYAVFCLK